MRKFCLAFLSAFLCISVVNAAGRTQNTVSRGANTNISNRQSENVKNTSVSRTSTTRTSITSNSAKKNQSKKTVSRSAAKKTVSARVATNPRSGAIIRNTTPARRISRAATTIKSFGDNYNICREAYFSCMDQFCATQNDTYRRCVCSSRINGIKKQEKLLSQTSDNLEDFTDLNIDAISKTANEVKSMLSASEGEASMTKDTSDSGKTLNNISEVLQKTKNKSLSTAGTLDAAGDIKSVWAKTDFISSIDIANLTGESLYNAVHAQCSEIVSQNCTQNDFKMIVSAYGMYIENDCSVLANDIDTKTIAANAAIRTTRHKMQDTRLENYNTHNSLTTNDCITKVKQDITSASACGEGYVHCLDISGKYLNIQTGEPIYSADFYQLENVLSLSNDVLKDPDNTAYVNILNKKRIFAQKSLDMCTDNADLVWDEFLRQAIVEIAQAQKQRVKNVKAECLKVVNECYLKKSDDLQDFSDNSSLISLGHTLELSEAMCADKLTTCSNLYGGGPEGLSVLVNTMMGITDQTIAQTCPELLTTFAQNVCAVSTNDSEHAYPYGCRVYAPGESIYAKTELCNTTLVNPFSRSDILLVSSGQNNVDTRYVCANLQKHYTSCEFNYYLYSSVTNAFSASAATECRACPQGRICTGGTAEPQEIDQNLYQSCGIYYIGSLYQQLVRYALQNCTRPSNDTYILPDSILADVDMVMKSVQSNLKSALATECAKYEGSWVDIPWQDDNSDGAHDLTGDTLLQDFYSETGANKLWGYCK